MTWDNLRRNRWVFRCNNFLDKTRYVREHDGSLLFSTGTPLTILIPNTNTKSKEHLFRQCFGVITGAVCSYIFIDGAVSTLKLQIMIEGIIQQSISKITLSLQNDLDTVQQKGVAVGKIMDFNSWLFESGKNIPFIENLIYDKNYKITATVSEGYIGEQIWRYAVVILIILLIAAVAGLSLQLIIGAIERIFVKRNRENANKAIKPRGNIAKAQ